MPEAAWSVRRARELVQFLALSPRRTARREAIVEALWPSLSPEAGSANLRKAVHFARKALGESEALDLLKGSVTLFPSSDVSVDVDVWESEANTALHGGDAEACRGVAHRYDGPLLPDVANVDWVELPRSRLEAKYDQLLRACSGWRDLLSRDPTDEEAVRGLMHEALARGSPSAAVRHYGKLVGALARDHDAQPSDETIALYDRCVAGMETASSTLVGRHAELAAIADALRGGPRERPNTFVVRGPAGIGKTALCRQAMLLARQERWATVELDTARRDQPLAPLVDLAERVLAGPGGVIETLPEGTRHTLAQLSPGADTVDPPAGPLGRHQVVGAIRSLVFAHAEGEPVALLVDDADALDLATMEIVFQIADSGGPILLVLTYRSDRGAEALGRGVARLVRSGRARTIDLRPLDQEDAEHLVLRSAPFQVTPEVARRVARLGEGNPFVTAEIAQALDADHPDTLPPDAVSAITRRFVDLAPDVVDVLQRVALATEDVDLKNVVALTGDTEDAAARVLDVALKAGVLVVFEGRYRFRHALVRQALVDRVPPHERLAVHRDAARRLTALSGSPSVIADHWIAGDRPAEAVPWLLRAAEQAMAVGALSDALAHLDRLLDHDPHHAAALRARAEALDLSGHAATLAAYDLAIQAAPETERGDLRAMRALAQLKQGDPSGALKAIRGVETESVQGRLSEALTYAGAAALGVTDPALGTEKAAECRRLALESGDTAAIVVASWAHAAAAHARGELRTSVLTDLRDTKELPHLAVRVFDGQLCITQRLLYGARPYPDVVAFGERLADEARRLGAPRGEAFGVTLAGEALLLSGRLEEAGERLSLGAELHEAIGGATGRALALQRLAEAALYAGRRDRAAALLDEALDVARQTDIGFHLLDRIYGTKVALAADGDEALRVVEEAEYAVRGPLETCPGCRITYAVPAAIASAKAGDLVRAKEYEESTRWLAEVVMRLPAWDAALEEVRGHLAGAQGRAADVVRHFRAAAHQFEVVGQPLDAARCSELAEAAR